ncbi:MAG TPA: hypothetical protein V6D06_17835 [Trichocoleus sp.]
MPNSRFNHHQRIQHIVASYSLSGDESDLFEAYLIDLMQVFPAPLIELAIVETLVQQWLRVPLLRGPEFLRTAHEMLTDWQGQVFQSRLTPTYFELITGLDPAPIFKALETLVQGYAQGTDAMTGGA